MGAYSADVSKETIGNRIVFMMLRPLGTRSNTLAKLFPQKGYSLYCQVLLGQFYAHLFQQRVVSSLNMLVIRTLP